MLSRLKQRIVTWFENKRIWSSELMREERLRITNIYMMRDDARYGFNSYCMAKMEDGTEVLLHKITRENIAMTPTVDQYVNVTTYFRWFLGDMEVRETQYFLTAYQGAENREDGARASINITARLTGTPYMRH